MILIFGGTTEGRIAAEVCDRAGRGFLYSTKSGDQRVVASHAEYISGAMSSEEIGRLIHDRGVTLIIDAAHPYAEVLHQNIADAAALESLQTIRLERRSRGVESPNIEWFESMESAVEHIKSENICDLLALTGVKSAALLAPIAASQRTTLRIMDREESNEIIERVGYPVSQLLYYDFEGRRDEAICRELSIRAILTKESGRSGGFEEKVALAESLGLPLLVVSRPELPHFTRVVYGQHSLRRAIEELEPNYFELRSGFTTGSAATAATLAAVKAIVTGEILESVEITLPNDELYRIDIERVERTRDGALAVVVKDGGDDPDATHNIEIISTVTLTESSQIAIRGGVGVGRVTLPGIGLEVGESAINPVPREMILRNIEPFKLSGLEIEISVPEGEKIGAKSFNPRLGIVGGISILGTSGIVQPFSSEAFLESIKRQIDVVKSLGYQEIVINSGAMSERYIKSRNPDLAPQCYIHYGNLIGDTIALAERCGVSRVVLGVMIGKAVKLAAGALDTHSRNVTIDREFLCEVAEKAGCATSTISQIKGVTTARQLWQIIESSEQQFFTLIKECCYTRCKPLLPNGELEIVLISESGELI